MTSDVFDAADRSEVTLLALLDLSTAFDTVDHSILMQRLHDTNGLHSTVLGWFKSFLTDRTQAVSFLGAKSAAVNKTCAMPQRFVLGPPLFTLYTADVLDLTAYLDINMHCYADNLQIYVHCSVSTAHLAVEWLINCILSIDR